MHAPRADGWKQRWAQFTSLLLQIWCKHNWSSARKTPLNQRVSVAKKTIPIAYTSNLPTKSWPTWTFHRVVLCRCTLRIYGSGWGVVLCTAGAHGQGLLLRGVVETLLWTPLCSRHRVRSASVWQNSYQRRDWLPMPFNSLQLGDGDASGTVNETSRYGFAAALGVKQTMAASER